MSVVEENQQRSLKTSCQIQSGDLNSEHVWRSENLEYRLSSFKMVKKS